MSAHAIASKWITDRNFDLLWYIGPCVATYFLMFSHFGLGVGVMTLWAFWVVVVDGPHVFGTISRTYLDAEEWRTRRRLLIGSLVWFLPGPVAVLIGIGTGSRQPFEAFLLFASLWAYWHVVRQHYGFLCLYQRKNSEPAGKENDVDYWTYYTLMLAPLGCFILVNDQARGVMQMAAEPAAWEPIALLVLQATIAAAAIVYVGKEVVRWRSGDAMNVPKNLFLASVVPVHLLVCLYPPIATSLHILLFSVFVTFHHNVQYHGIVWFYNRNRYRGEGARERFGLATLVSSSFLFYYAAGLLFAFTVRYTSWFFTGMQGIPGGPGPNALSMTDLGSSYTVAELSVAFWWGFALHHYYLDQKIWRVSKDKKVQKHLGVQGASA